ncbi:MAG: ABC transporter permease [Candidatus Helarchaeota archaeon]
MFRVKKEKKGLLASFDLEAILGIARREYIKYFRNKNQIISSSLMPAIFMIFMRPAFGNWIGNMGEASTYMGAGIIVMVVIMSGIMMAGMPLIFDKMMGFQDIYAVSPVKRRNLVLGFILGGAIKVIFQCSIVIAIGLLSGLISFELGVYPYDFGWFAAGYPVFGVLAIIMSAIMMYVMIFISAAVYSCIGLTISAKSDMTNAFLYFTLINMPLVFISGALIPVENMYFIGLFNPTTYFADAIRVFLGGYTGDYGTGNFIIGILGLSIPKHSAQALFLGLGFDLIVMFAFGVVLFYIAFKVFGSSLTESSGGFISIFHKKTAEMQEKMFKKLSPEEKEAMNRITSKVDMIELMSSAQEDPSKIIDIFKKAGLTTDDANQFMKIGTKIMSEMVSKKKKKKKKSKNKT